MMAEEASFQPTKHPVDDQLFSLSPPFIVSQQLASYASHEPVETVEYVCFVVEFIALFMHADLSADATI